jgi:hypothetical protein
MKPKESIDSSSKAGSGGIQAIPPRNSILSHNTANAKQNFKISHEKAAMRISSNAESILVGG